MTPKEQDMDKEDALKVFVVLKDDILVEILIEYPIKGKLINTKIRSSPDMTNQQLLLAYRVLQEFVEVKSLIPDNIPKGKNLDILVTTFEEKDKT